LLITLISVITVEWIDNIFYREDQKSKPVYYRNNSVYVYCQPTVIIFGIYKIDFQIFEIKLQIYVTELQISVNNWTWIKC